MAMKPYQAGAEVVAGAREVFDRAELVLKVKEPKLNKELGRMKPT